MLPVPARFTVTVQPGLLKCAARFTNHPARFTKCGARFTNCAARFTNYVIKTFTNCPRLFAKYPLPPSFSGTWIDTHWTNKQCSRHDLHGKLTSSLAKIVAGRTMFSYTQARNDYWPVYKLVWMQVQLQMGTGRKQCVLPHTQGYRSFKIIVVSY